MDVDQGVRKRIKALEVMVAEVVVETPDATTLVLFTGNDRLEYQPGHFLTIDPHQFDALARWTAFLEEGKNKKEPPRAYSIASARHENRLAITIKEERFIPGTTRYPPLLSPLLVRRTLPGTRMTITGFTGPYTLPPDIESKTDHLLHVCAGSGIVPNYSILKHALEQRMKLRHTLIYANKSWDDVIYRRQLDELRVRFPEKLEIIHCLSRESNPRRFPGHVRVGRVDEGVLRSVLADPKASHVFLCGPAVTKHERAEARARGVEPQPRFLDSALAALASIGVSRAQIHQENYG
jgi:3-ketosteroid 9alpha-monooxygenase subunit B